MLPLFPRPAGVLYIFLSGYNYSNLSLSESLEWNLTLSGWMVSWCHMPRRTLMYNQTLHDGVGVFEGIRSHQTLRGPAMFRLRDHLERFIDSIQVQGIVDYPYSIDQIR